MKKCGVPLAWKSSARSLSALISFWYLCSVIAALHLVDVEAELLRVAEQIVVPA